MIWGLPKDDLNYSLRWKKIKTLFTKSVIKSGIKFPKTKHNEYRLGNDDFGCTQLKIGWIMKIMLIIFITIH